MKSLIALVVILASSGLAIPCQNREAHESTNTTYDAPVSCGEVNCPMSSHKVWTYSCQPDTGTNCNSQPNMIIRLDTIHWCDGVNCQVGTATFYGVGRVTSVCP